MKLQQLLEHLPWSHSHSNLTVPPVPQRSQWPGIDRSDLRAALIFHSEWCALFNEQLATAGLPGPEAAPLPGARASDLGKWLSALVLHQIGPHPQLLELEQEHQRLHTLAQEALEHARLQRLDLASNLLNTEFERSRLRVLELLRRLQRP